MTLGPLYQLVNVGRDVRAEEEVRLGCLGGKLSHSWPIGLEVPARKRNEFNDASLDLAASIVTVKQVLAIVRSPLLPCHVGGDDRNQWCK